MASLLSPAGPALSRSISELAALHQDRRPAGEAERRLRPAAGRGRRSCFLSAFVVLAGLALAACGGSPAAPPQPGARLRVVASFSVPADWTRQIGGPSVEVASLVAPGGDVHTFDPRPADSRRLAEADLIVAIGAGLEPWLPPLADAAGGRAVRLDLAGAVEGELGLQAAGDPHRWLDPLQASAMVARLASELAALDPADGAGYRSRAESYRHELAALDGWIRARLATVPAPRRRLVTQHDFLSHFARRYGLEVVGNVLASTSTETADPSAASLAALAARARAAGVVVFFPEQGHDSRLLEALAAEVGARVGPPLLAGGLAPSGQRGSTYLDMMRYDTDSLVAALAR